MIMGVDTLQLSSIFLAYHVHLFFVTWFNFLTVSIIYKIEQK